MALLPEPALTLTIPSIHDGTVLDCRVYHPASLAANPRAPPWRRHAAVFAHPYAPMGGSYDDPILELVVAQLLRKGYLVGTFNFRGASHSAGRTSWTAKPERDDYASFVGFMVYYIHYLDPFQHHPTDPHLENDKEPAQVSEHDHEPDPELHPKPALRPPQITISADPAPSPVLILGGYSYGAMVTTQLPPLGQLIQPFATPAAESDAAHIRMRAEHLATQQNLVLGSARSIMRQHRSPSSPVKRGGVRIGGDEGESPRKSHESFGRRSFSLDGDDKLRKGVHDFMARRRSSRHSHRLHLQTHSASASASRLATPASPGVADVDTTGHDHDNNDEATEKEQPHKETIETMPAVSNLLVPKPAYLLVSPLQGLITHLATMNLVPTALSSRPRHHRTRDEAAEEKLWKHPTMAVYGDGDTFVPVSRLRSWSKRLGAKENTQFQSYEVASAGHFWSQEGVLYRMQEMVSEFSGKLIDS